MEDFLVKSILCQITLIGIYYLFLEREKMHKFNRFFLLFSLAFSLLIPFVSVEVYQEIAPIQIQNQLVFEENPIILSDKIAEPSVDYLPLFLWSFYGFTTFILGIRFGLNLYKIKKRIQSSLKEIHETATLVLSEEKILPHTFLNYIFINKTDFENRNIEQELYAHELTHARQKHTLDVLLIEILKTIFWFNPILILYKKAIQLNHEFLADEKVVTIYNVSFYQKLLLEKASWNNNFNLVSNLNFLVTKKRLLMMTKTTSKNKALVKKMTLIPLFAGIAYFACIKTVAQEKAIPTEKTQKYETQISTDKDKQRDIYFAGVRFIVYKNRIETKSGITGKEIIINKLYEELTAKDIELCNISMFLAVREGFKKNSPTKKELEDFQNTNKYAIWIDGKNVKNSELNKFKPSEIAYFSGSVILKNARSKKHPQPFQYWFYTHEYFDKNEMGKTPEKYGSDKIEIFMSTTLEKPVKRTASIPVQETEKSGFLIINGQTHYYLTKNGETQYFDRLGNKVDKNGNGEKKITTSEIAVKSDTNSGYLSINDQTYFYTTENGIKKYYDRNGNNVNEKGEKIQ